jgi:hypothetical protein
MECSAFRLAEAAQQSEVSSHLMARKSAPYRSTAKRHPRRSIAALLSQARGLGRAVRSQVPLSELVKRRTQFETLLARLGDTADELVPTNSGDAPASRDERRLSARLRRAEARLGTTIQAIEHRIAQRRSRNIADELVKLGLYAELQGYDRHNARRRRGAIPIEEKLFWSVVADLKRMDRA